MSVYSSVKNITLTMRHGRMGKLYWFLTQIKLKKYVGRAFHHIQADRDKVNPTKEMIASREYYKTHENEIEQVCALLEDEESVKTYKAMWRFRGTHNYKDLPQIEEEKQYFGYHFFEFSNGEKLIDCGAYDGDTINAFEKCMKQHKINEYSTVAIEADPVNCEYIAKRRNVEVINKGVWDREDVLRFVVDDETEGRIFNGGEEQIDGVKISEIPVINIDSIEECSDATIIKMDVEGAEWQALHGAVKLIKRNRPKLSICIYHSDDDMIRIIKWINDLHLNYCFYIRQHSDTRHETVLYAVPMNS